MLKPIAVMFSVVLLGASPAWAGLNLSAKLAIHVVTSREYLSCADLTPAACESINVDVSVQEVLAADGYGYVAFVAYDVEGITGAEFAVDGWPTGRGAPQLSGPYWCPEGTLTMGNHLGSGGISSFPCVEASLDGIVLIGYCSFGPLDEEDLPITLEYVASSFSYPNEPHNLVLDCTVQYQEDTVVASTGCTIGRTQVEHPDCPGERGGGDEGDSDEPGQVFGVDTLLVIDNPEAEDALVVLNGQRIEYPFTLAVAWKDEAQFQGELRINGIVARTQPRPRPVPNYPVGDLAKMRRLLDDARELEAGLYHEGLSRTERAMAVADMLRSVDWIESVEVLPTSVLIHPRPEEEISTTEFTVYPRGAERPPHEVPLGPPDVRGVFLANAKRFGNTIAGGGYLIMGDNHFPVGGGRSLRTRIERRVSQMVDTGEVDPTILLADIPELMSLDAAAELLSSTKSGTGDVGGE